MKNNQDIPAQTPKDLLHDLQALVTEAEKMMSAAAGEQDPDALDTLRARFEAAQENFGELYAGARQRVVAGARYTDTAIRENPYQSIAIATGVGLLLGVLVGRQCNKQ